MLSNKRLVTVCGIAFCCNIAAIALFIKYNAGAQWYATIDERQEATVDLPDDFLSFGIDTSEVRLYDLVDFKNSKLRALAAALAPARLRLGGTLSERLIFSGDDENISCDCNTNTTKSCYAIKRLCRHKFLPFFILTGSKWADINEFCIASGVKLLFSMNVMLRDQHNEWSETNAEEILEYSRRKGYSIDWQLGNEPNSFKHVFNISISPQMLAKDFKKLRKLLNHHGYKNSLLVGPDTTRPQPQKQSLEYMVQFLGNGSHAIDARSWHQYYLNSREAKLEDFWNPDTFNFLNVQIETMINHTKKYAHKPMWLTETSSSYGGGAPGLSNSYAGSPLWIDKLGLAAKYGIKVVVRQSFIGGNYSMVDKYLEPLPDWWISVLYKRLVGNKVLNIGCHGSRFHRMYAHCANRKYTNDTTAITIYALNLEMAKATFLLNGTALHGDNLSIDEYIISAPSNNRRSKTVLLNGWPLYLESLPPDFQPKRLKYGNHISMPPYSIGFWVVRNTSIKVCE